MKLLLTASLTLMAGVIAALLPVPASAVQLTDQLSLTGFFSLDATYADSASANLPRPIGQTSDLEKHKVSFDSSVFGLRADLGLTTNLSASLQLVSTGQTDNSYKPDTEWLYLQYDFANDISVRGGQLELPFLQGTELRYVGHSRLWARPVVPNNGMGGFDTFRGAEVYYSTYAGDYDLQWHLSYGKPEHDQGAVSESTIALASLALEQGNAKARLAFLQSDYDAWTGEEYAYSGNLKMASLEGEYAYQHWITHAGLITDADHQFMDEYLGYFSLGYRINQFTPYVFYSRNVMNFESLAFFGQDDDLYDEFSPEDYSLEELAYIEDNYSGERTVKTLALGVRYELTPQLSLKFQWEQQKQRDKSFIGLPDQKNRSNLYTLVFEGVF